MRMTDNLNGRRGSGTRGTLIPRTPVPGLEGMEHRRPLKLSGGQQQRVAVARAVLGEPALVLADEPTANLDSTTAEALLAVMQQLNRDRGTTFVFSTHDPRVMKRGGRLIRLVDGRIAEDVVRGRG